jgi:hypothetical protein
MLGRYHGSVEHFYVPRLLFQNVKVPVGSQAADSRMYNLFKLDWDSVDKFKQDSYVKWVEDHWQEQFPAALRGKMPGTLPPRYDDIIKGLVFALPHDYQVAVQHFTQLYYTERHRVWKFDTVIREMCLKPAEAAINTAFKLIADCCYDMDSKCWLRQHSEVDKRLISCLLRYKFWRESTVRGPVWDRAGLDDLDRFAGQLLQKGHQRSDTELGTKYRQCLTEIKQWEMDEEKFRDFISVGVGKLALREIPDDLPIKE